MAQKNNAQSAQMMEMMTQMMEQMKLMSERMDALENERKTRTCKAQPKAEEKKMVDFVKRDGTVIRVSEAQAANMERWRNGAKEPTEAQQKRIDAIKASKAREPELTRKLEKALGLKPNSLKNTACTADECRALGWKGTRKELKALKAQIRASK